MEAATQKTIESAPEDRPTYINPKDLVEISDASTEEQTEIDTVEANPSLASMKHLLIPAFGGIVGFIGLGYVNNYLSNAIAGTVGGAKNASVVALVLDIAVAFVAQHAAKSGSETKRGFLEGFAIGSVLAGVGSVVYQFTSASGNPVVLPSVSLGPAGNGLVPQNRAVAA